MILEVVFRESESCWGSRVTRSRCVTIQMNAFQLLFVLVLLVVPVFLNFDLRESFESKE